MDWNDVRHFLALARLGSVRAAGASLGVSHSTVARRVEALETLLGTRLFDRHRDGYTLTEAGRQMVPGVERVEQEMAAIERGLVGQDERLEGPVALTCCDHYVSAMLVSALARFVEEAPGIELCVTTDSRPFDLSKREADVAVRAVGMGTSPPEHLLGMRLAPLQIGTYVATAHASRLDPDLGGTTPRWVGYDDRRIHNTVVASSAYPDAPLWGSFSTLELMVQAIRAGLGFGTLPTYVGDQEPALQRMSRTRPRHVADLWLLSHVDLRDNVRFRAVRTQIREAFDVHASWFRSEGGTPWTTGAPLGPEFAPDAPGVGDVR